MSIIDPVPRYQQLASLLRSAILDGTYPAGGALPSEAELSREYGLSRPTVRQAISLLETEGLVISEHGRGTFVRTHPERRRVTRDRQVHRDEIGYYFDPQAVNWRPIVKPTASWGKAPAEIARLLAIPVGSPVVIRDRQMGEPGGPPLQLATSYLPEWLARGTQLERADTGPGGIYDRMEETGHKLHWVEAVSARMPTPEEAKALRLPPGVPVLRILRTTLNQEDKPLEVNDTRMSADLFEISYPLERAPDA